MPADSVWTKRECRKRASGQAGDNALCALPPPCRVVAVYQRAEYLPERRDAFERLGAHLEGLVRNEPGVVPPQQKAAQSNCRQ